MIVTIIFINIPLEEVKATSKNEQMKMHFIDVGQGDSILIETPNNKIMLIDGGPPEAGKEVVSYLKQHQIKKIDLVVSTHPDFDHIGGLIEVIKQFPVKEIYDSGKVHHTQTYRKYMALIEKQKIPLKIVHKNEKVKLDTNLHIKVLNSYEKGKTNNESALAFEIQFNHKQILLLSDIEKKQEKEIIEKGEFQADLIKIAHHGSKTSSSMHFLKTVKPNIAILTYDKENDFGHPSPTVINNLLYLDVNIYSTAVFGNTVYVTDGDHYLLQFEKSPLQNILN